MGSGQLVHGRWCRYPALNTLHTVVPAMVGGEQLLWGELTEVLGDAGAFEPEGKSRRWTTFFDSGSAFGAELRSEIRRAKRAFAEAPPRLKLRVRERTISGLKPKRREA